MKKVITILLIMLCIGCGKKLTCTYKQNYEDVEINNKIVFNFDSNTYTQTDTMVFKESSEASKYFKDIYEYIDEYNLILKDNKIVSELSGIIDKTRKELKNRYEGYDYKCN